MLHEDEKSNAQSWELEVTCKNKEYLNAVVKSILKHGKINFTVESVDTDSFDSFGDRYLVLMWGVWFDNLHKIAKSLKKIQNKLDVY